MFSSYSSYTSRIESLLRGVDLLLVVALCVVAYYFPATMKSTHGYVTAVAWFAGLVMVGGQNPAYLHPRYRIVLSMLLAGGLAALVDIVWAGSGHAWYLEGGLHSLAALTLAGTVLHFLIASVLQRPAIQLVPCCIAPEFLPLLEELGQHPHIYLEPMLEDPAGELPARRHGYPIFLAISDLRLSLHDFDHLAPLYPRIELVDLCDLYEAMMGKVAIVETAQGWVLPKALRMPSPVREGLKRAFEVLLVVATAPLTLLIIAIAAEAVKLSSPGPIFFTQERVGRFGKRFRMVKLRTMRCDAELQGKQWSGKCDPRVTPVGRFLRASGLDELPQLWNILRGEMSFIGPRPESPEIIARQHLEERIPFYTARHLILPGVAGWAQLHQGGDTNLDDVINKVRYDLYYLKYGTFPLDLRIILGTLQMIFHMAKPAPKPAATRVPAVK